MYLLLCNYEYGVLSQFSKTTAFMYQFRDKYATIQYIP